MPTGLSTNRRFANSFHDPLFKAKLSSPWTRYGPTSINAPSSELHPGPPFSQMTVLCRFAICLFSKCQKKRLPLVSGVTSMWLSSDVSANSCVVTVEDSLPSMHLHRRDICGQSRKIAHVVVCGRITGTAKGRQQSQKQGKRDWSHHERCPGERHGDKERLLKKGESAQSQRSVPGAGNHTV